MGRPKRSVQAAAEESLNPPDELTPTQSLAKVIKGEGNNLYTCELPNKKTVVLELEPKFRNTVWLKRGGYVLIDVGSAEEERKSSSRVVGEIINVVRDEKLWRKQAYWPKEFEKRTYDESDDDESTAGKMPPSDSEDDD
ncbi:nucleic acid-binding protein, partial [Coniochaeta ligniaria NRRL 30616]